MFSYDTDIIILLDLLLLYWGHYMTINNMIGCKECRFGISKIGLIPTCAIWCVTFGEFINTKDQFPYLKNKDVI